MKRTPFLHVVPLLSTIILAACGSDGGKIGSMIKGERIAIMEQTKSVEPDPALQGVQPSVPRMIETFAWTHPGFDSTHVMPSIQASPLPEVLWKAYIGKGSSSRFKLLSRPVANSDAVFTMDSRGLVRAFDLKAGKNLWSFDTTPENSGGAAIGGGIATNGETVFATTGFGDVCAIDAQTGKILWRKSFQKPLRAAPTVANDRVFVLSIDNDLNALNASTGAVLWSQSGVAESATLMGASSPAVSGDMVVVAYNSGEIQGLRTQNGRATWSYSLAAPAQIGALPAIADIRGLPVIYKGQIFAISHSGRMAAIDQRTGDRIWETEIGGTDTPVVTDDAVFVYSGTGQLVALARETGRVIWTSALPQHEDPNDKSSDPVIWAGPVLSGESLWMVNSKGALASFSPEEGLALETIDIGDPLYLAPIVVDHIYYIVTNSGTLVALR